MLGLLAALAFSVSPALAPPGTALALVVPHPRAGLAAARSFLEHAGKLAPTLAPGPLGLELGSALSVDLLDPAAWEAAGLDLDAPATLALRGDDALLVLGVRDPKKLAARAQSGLGAFGTVSPGKLKGGALWTAHQPGVKQPTLAGAVALRGRRAAVLVHGETTEWLLAALDSKPLAALSRAKDIAGDVLIVSPGGAGPTAVIGLSASADLLGIDGEISAPSGVVRLPPRDAFAEVHPHALLWASADMAGWGLAATRGELAAWVRFLVAQMCRDCSTRPEDQLAATLAGPAAFMATRLAPEQSRRPTDLDRYFLVPEAQGAQVRDPVAAHAALASLLDELRAHHAAAEAVSRPGGEHYQLRLGEQRAVYFGLVGATLYLANAPDARDAFLESLPAAPRPPTHAGLVHLDGPTAAQLLTKLSVFDAAASPDLASLFGLAVEAAPLLRALGDVELTVDAAGSAARIRGVLHLPASTP